MMLKVSTDGGRHLGPRPLHLRVPAGRRPGRPDHRGRPEHRSRLRGVDGRLRHEVLEVDRPRRHLVAPGEGLRQGQLDRQADPRDERRRSERLRRLQRPLGRRRVHRAVDERRARRGRRPRSSTRPGTTSPSTATSCRTARRSSRRRASPTPARDRRRRARSSTTRSARRTAAPRWTNVLVDSREIGDRVRGRRLLRRLLPGARRRERRRERQPRLPARRRDDRGWPPDGVRATLDRRRRHLDRARSRCRRAA